ncbi:MAG: hypothetical protein JXR94_06685 [Candidatus Hydrogenedentes bacterium]|nr:hypothetical protein [Candidatus Hydrogenedentota bacterium]
MRGRRELSLAALSAVVAALFWFCVALLMAGPQPAASDRTSEEIRASMMEGFSAGAGETAAEEFAADYGSVAVPVLIEMLGEQDELPVGVRARIAICLGKLGDPAAVQPLIDCIEQPVDVLEWREYKEFSCMITSLGFIGSDEALTYLAKLSTEEYWEKRAEEQGGAPVIWHDPDGQSVVDAERTRRSFRKCALMGLGVSGKPKARELLLELRQGATGQMLAEVDTEIERCGERERRWRW